VFCLVIYNMTVNAQVKEVYPNVGRIYYQTQPSAPFRSSQDSIFWTDNFNDTNEWAYSGGTGKWNIGIRLTDNLVQQGLDSVINSTSSGPFAYIDSDEADTGATQSEYLTLNNPIDCSALSFVRLRFNNYFRQLNETRSVEISTDSSTWNTIDVFPTFPVNTSSSNPMKADLDITNLAAGQSSVYIRFHYEGSFDWFWAIDDIELYAPPENLIELQEVYYGTGSTYQSIFYTLIPDNQSNNMNLSPSGRIGNLGSSDQDSTYFRALFKSVNGTDSALLVSPKSTLEAGLNEIYQVDGSVNALGGSNQFTMEVEALTQNLTAPAAGSTASIDFELSTNDFRWDNDSVTEGNWVLSEDGVWGVAVMYELFNPSAFGSISAYFPREDTLHKLYEGDEIKAFVLNDLSDGSTALDTLSILERYIITADDTNGWLNITLPFADLPAGRYFVGLEFKRQEISIGSNTELNGQIPESLVFTRRGAGDKATNWQMSQAFLPFIRIKTKNDAICDTVNIEVITTVDDDQTIGTITTDVTGGTPPYAFLWSSTDSTGYKSNEQNLDDITFQGTYDVVVSDINGCSGTASASVGGIVSLNDIDGQDIWVYPTPVKGDALFVELEQSTPYEISIRDLQGRIVLQVARNQANRSIINVSNLSSGTYIIHVKLEERDIFKKILIQK
jgi:hypothetical protein